MIIVDKNGNRLSTLFSRLRWIESLEVAGINVKAVVIDLQVYDDKGEKRIVPETRINSVIGFSI